MSVSSAPAVQWEQLRPGIWWGSRGGDLVGSISQQGWRFRTRDAADTWLGDYPTLVIARSIVQCLER
jgi:hypothetical protein